MIGRIAILGLMAGLLPASAALAVEEPPLRKATGQGSALVFKRIDTNHDGRVSKAEFESMVEKVAERGQGKGQGKGQATGERLFERLDADRDGSLVPSEFEKLQEFRARMQGGRGGNPGAGAARRPGGRAGLRNP